MWRDPDASHRAGPAQPRERGLLRSLAITTGALLATGTAGTLIGYFLH